MRRALTLLVALALLAGQAAASFVAAGTGPVAEPAHTECPCCPDDVGADECLAVCLGMTGVIPLSAAVPFVDARVPLLARPGVLLLLPAETPPTPPPIL